MRQPRQPRPPRPPRRISGKGSVRNAGVILRNCYVCGRFIVFVSNLETGKKAPVDLADENGFVIYDLNPWLDKARHQQHDFTCRQAIGRIKETRAPGYAVREALGKIGPAEVGANEEGTEG